MPMKPVVPIEIVLPDGVSRQVRFTQGARKRIQDRFGKTVLGALQEVGDACFPAVIFCMLYDADGNPPRDITEAQIAEMMNPDDAAEIMATIMAAFMQGKKSKNELIPLIQAAMEEMAKQQMNGTGTKSGSSAGPLERLQGVLDSQTTSSGTDSSSAKSKRSSRSTAETS